MNTATNQLIFLYTAILLLFALKHVLADFVLQTGAIARAKDARSGWQRALALHGATHGAMTLAIAVLVSPRLWWLGVVDGFIHAGIDRTKSLVGQRLQAGPADTKFWWLLGTDQFLHQVTHIALACWLVTQAG